MALNIKMIRDSFAIAKPIAPQVVNRFYEVLWNDYPESKALFEKVDMKRQKVALANSLVKIVDSLEDPEGLTKYLKDMGARHVGYGAEFAHYDAVGASLLKTFAEFFGRDWTQELENEWRSAYGIIASVMKEGAAAHSVKEKAPPVGISRPSPQVQEADPLESSPVILTEAARSKIRHSVQQAVRQQILDEIRRAEAEELSQVEKLGVEHYLKAS